VLEYLYDADKLLRQSWDLLNAGGKVLVSLPNVANFKNRLGLFKGDWHYRDEGILDRTHIRFYTLAKARKFLTDGGVLQYEKWNLKCPSSIQRGSETCFHF
jgi:hypothetical protein